MKRPDFPISLALCATFMIAGGAQAGDIRLTAKPDPAVTIKQFGYSAANAQAMLTGTRDDLWSLVPPRGWINPTTYALKNKMYVALGGSGFDDPMANVIINMCKVYARDPYHCVIYASAVSCAESSCAASWKAASVKNNIFGVNVPGISYPSRTAAAKNWIRDRYNAFWYTANEGYFYSYCKHSYFCAKGKDFDVYAFYSNSAAKPPTFRYCLSELQPNGTKIDGYCPNGYNNAKIAYLNVR